MPEDNLSTLPQAIPLRSVSPLWRMLAILAFLGLVVASAVAVVLGLAAWSDSRSNIFMTGTVPLTAGVQMFTDDPDAEPLPPGMLPGGFPPDQIEPGGPDSRNPSGLPYPIKADLADVGKAGPSLPSTPSRDTAARRFLLLGADAWKSRRGLDAEYVTIFPDGAYFAATSQGKLTTWTVSEGSSFEPTVTDLDSSMGVTGGGGTGAALEGVPHSPAGAPGGPGSGPGDGTPRAAPIFPLVLGEPSWQRDPPLIHFPPVILFSASDGRMRCYNAAGGPGERKVSTLSFTGELPTLLGWDRLLFVRLRSGPKADHVGDTVLPDPAEIVERHLATGKERIVVPASRCVWRHLALNPEGTQVAGVSNRDDAGLAGPTWRVFDLDLASGALKPVSPAMEQLGPVCWTPDGKALVYARAQKPAPGDHWEQGPASRFATLDLFHLDLSTGREVRLTRGGGFSSPNVTMHGQLYYLTGRSDDPKVRVQLRKMPLQAALDFAAREGEPPARTAAAWRALVEKALRDAGLAADATGEKLTPDRLGLLAEAFARQYHEVFKSTPPPGLDGLDQLAREIASLDLLPAEQPPFRLVLGAVVGSYLKQEHAASWKLTAAPLVAATTRPDEDARESPFAQVFNPFALPFEKLTIRAGKAGSERPWSFRDDVLSRKRGRVLVLSNQTGNKDELLRDMADPDLQRGEELLREGKFDEGEVLLRDLLQKAPHKDNETLALHVGQVLYVHQRYTALNNLMKHWTQKQPYDARRFNLLGLALLEVGPANAVNAFRSALRCDLRYGPAYLNLAMAYQKLNQTGQAMECLERYLYLFPDGPLARDAHRRLGELRQTAGTPMGDDGR